MTPREKAEELFKKYLNEMPKYLQGKLGREKSKQCALICVDEIIESGTWEHIDWKYWQDVKQEIEKL